MQGGNAPKNVEVEPIAPGTEPIAPGEKEKPADVEVELPIGKREQPVEVRVERPKEQPAVEKSEQPLTPVQPPSNKSVAPQKSETFLEIERILEDDLFQAYQAMDEPTKRRFRSEGEKTASKIEVLLRATKVQVKKILGLIKNWLKIIPRINKHFLIQEAKIKTDRIIAIKDSNK